MGVGVYIYRGCCAHKDNPDDKDNPKIDDKDNPSRKRWIFAISGKNFSKLDSTNTFTLLKSQKFISKRKYKTTTKPTPLPTTKTTPHKDNPKIDDKDNPTCKWKNAITNVHKRYKQGCKGGGGNRVSAKILYLASANAPFNSCPHIPPGTFSKNLSLGVGIFPQKKSPG